LSRVKSPPTKTAKKNLRYLFAFKINKHGRAYKQQQKTNGKNTASLRFIIKTQNTQRTPQYVHSSLRGWQRFHFATTTSLFSVVGVDLSNTIKKGVWRGFVSFVVFVFNIVL